MHILVYTAKISDSQHPDMLYVADHPELHVLPTHAAGKKWVLVGHLDAVSRAEFPSGEVGFYALTLQGFLIRDGDQQSQTETLSS